MPSGAREAERSLGRYVLGEVIGSGGMACVHLGRARGAAGFTKNVAIKRLHTHLAHDPQFVSLFIDEARLSANIAHPNVVTTLDVVEEAGDFWLVMDFVLSVPLNVLVRRAHESGSAVPDDIAASIVVGALRGLHAAHEACGSDGAHLGIVHRDVSPHNILVCHDGTPKVVDFGIAKAAGRLTNTTTGQWKGKPSYMAPEQVRCEDIDRRTDIYGAGVVLWELLAGRKLHVAEFEDALGRAQAARPMPLPSALGATAALDDVVTKALRFAREERFASAQEMANAVAGAVPPATASAVSAWAESLAGDVFDKQRDIARRPESSVAMALDSSALNSASEVTRAAGPEGTAGERPRNRASTRHLVAVAAALAASMLAVGVSLTAGTSRIASAIAQPMNEAPHVVPPPRERASEAPVETPAAPRGVVSAPDTTAPAARSVPASPARAPRPRAHVPPPPPSSDPCSVRFTLDATGTKIPKRECL